MKYEGGSEEIKELECGCKVVEACLNRANWDEDAFVTID